jgi:hypothetical protein
MVKVFENSQPTQHMISNLLLNHRLDRINPEDDATFSIGSIFDALSPISHHLNARKVKYFESDDTPVSD